MVMMRVAFIFGCFHSSISKLAVFTAFTAFFASSFSHCRFSTATSEKRLWSIERMYRTVSKYRMGSLPVRTHHQHPQYVCSCVGQQQIAELRVIAANEQNIGISHDQIDGFPRVLRFVQQINQRAHVQHPVLQDCVGKAPKEDKSNDDASQSMVR